MSKRRVQVAKVFFAVLKNVPKKKGERIVGENDCSHPRGACASVKLWL